MKRSAITTYRLCLLLTIGSASAVEILNSNSNPIGTVHFIEQQLDISVEIAASQSQREQGLMHRTGLGEKQGMLFAYPDQAIRSVWMKNTLLPLDVLFINADGRIVAMLENLQPCRHDPCPIFESKKPAMYMLELNAHFSKIQQLKIDQRLQLVNTKK